MTETPTLSQTFDDGEFIALGVRATVDASVRAAAEDVLLAGGLADEFDAVFAPDPEEDAGDTELGGETLVPTSDINDILRHESELVPPDPTAKPYTKLDIEIPDAAVVQVEPADIGEDIVVEIPELKRIGRGLLRVKFDTFTFSEDVRSTIQDLVVIAIIATAIVLLFYYLLHQ